MYAKLVVVGGNIREPEIELSLPAVMGRSRSATVKLRHPLVSRQHCEIFEADGCLKVRDLSSMNGTFVGNQRVGESELRSGDLLTVGTVTFRIMCGAKAAAAPQAEGADTNDARGTATPYADETTYPVDPVELAEGDSEEPRTEPQDAEQT